MFLKYVTPICALIASATATAGNYSTCYEAVVGLAEFDHVLSTRSTTKTTKAGSTTTAADFVTAMTASSVKESGAYQSFACGLTRSYISEIYNGLSNQYKEYAGTETSTAGGYAEYIGANIVTLFNKYSSNNNHYIYQIKHIGTQDHDFIVEQLPNLGGYRIYQSYHDAFSQKAWMASSTDGLFDSGDMMVYTTVQSTFNSTLSSMTSGTVTLNNCADLPTAYAAFIPFCKFVAAYDKTQVLTYFKKAWDKWGSGKIISKTDFFATTGYIQKTSTLTQWLKTYDTTTTTFTQTIWDLWIELYGSPDPIYYPNIPANSIASIVLGTGKTFSTQIKVLDLGSSETTINTNCNTNAQIIYNAAVTESSAFYLLGFNVALILSLISFF